MLLLFRRRSTPSDLPLALGSIIVETLSGGANPRLRSCRLPVVPHSMELDSSPAHAGAPLVVAFSRCQRSLGVLQLGRARPVISFTARSTASAWVSHQAACVVVRSHGILRASRSKRTYVLLPGGRQRTEQTGAPSTTWTAKTALRGLSDRGPHCRARV